MVLVILNLSWYCCLLVCCRRSATNVNAALIYEVRWGNLQSSIIRRRHSSRQTTSGNGIGWHWHWHGQVTTRWPGSCTCWLADLLKTFRGQQNHSRVTTFPHNAPDLINVEPSWMGKKWIAEGNSVGKFTVHIWASAEPDCSFGSNQCGQLLIHPES